MTRTRLTLLFGFLGSGKTTLAKRILTEFGPKRRLALIVNEFGDVGVDGEILKGNSIDVIQISTGCLCCTLKGSLEAAVIEIAKNNEIDHLIVEATGVAEPEDVLASFAKTEFHDLVSVGPVVTVIDTPKFMKVRTMLGPFFEAQIEKCDYIILNKLDGIDAASAEAVKEEVLDTNPDAVIRMAEQCDVDLLEILDGPDSEALLRWTELENAAHARSHGHDHDHHDHDHDHHHGHAHALHAPAETFAIDMARPVSLDVLSDLYAKAPENLWRSKGFVKTADGKSHLVQVSMGDLQLSEVPARDRHYLVFIGDKLDQKWFEERLERAMVG